MTCILLNAFGCKSLCAHLRIWSKRVSSDALLIAEACLHITARVLAAVSNLVEEAPVEKP